MMAMHQHCPSCIGIPPNPTPDALSLTMIWLFKSSKATLVMSSKLGSQKGSYLMGSFVV